MSFITRIVCVLYICIEGAGVLDLKNQGLHKLESKFLSPADTQTLILDQNHIIKLEHLERNEALQQVWCSFVFRLTGMDVDLF